mgnify:CR=1 FL=1
MSDGKTWPVANPANQSTQLADVAALAEPQPPEQRDAQGRFLSGNNGGGRKRGSRNRLTETFIAAIETDCAEHGPEALAKLRNDDPAAYLRIVASLVPRDLILKREQAEDYSELSPEEINEMMKREHHNGMIAQWVEKARQGR